ncbi:MAG: hypothetical protein JXA53_01655 [Bacteroidales bacterium]|nr:hypothetical protein [Bacteroidales bacterium]
MNRIFILAVFILLFTSCYKDNFNDTVDTSEWEPEIAFPLMEGIIKINPDLTVENGKILYNKITKDDTIKDLSDLKKFANNTKSITFHFISNNHTPLKLSSRIILKNWMNQDLSYILDKSEYTTNKADTTNNIFSKGEVYATIKSEHIDKINELDYAIIETTIDITDINPLYKPKEGQNLVDIIVGAIITYKMN